MRYVLGTMDYLIDALLIRLARPKFVYRFLLSPGADEWGMICAQ